MNKQRKIILGIIAFLLLTISSYSHRETLLDYYKAVVSASSTLIERGKNKNYYAPWKAIDCNLKTAWVEGKKDSGFDEFLSIHVGLISKKVRSIEILSGCAINKKLFKMNNRPKDIDIVIYKEYDYFDSSNPKKKEKVYEEYIVKKYRLKDQLTYQRIDLNGIENVFSKIRSRTKIKIVIKSVYKGTRFNDTAISEIKLLDANGRDITKSARDKAIEIEKRTRHHKTPR